jgi:hypothetical protein
MLALVLALAAGIPCGPAVASTFTTTLTVKEYSGIARAAEPVTAGVPVPRAAGITDAGSLRMVDAGGREVPAQFRVTSRWGGGPAATGLPARWVLADFGADVAANGASTYRVESVRPAVSTALRVTRNDSSYLTISTGQALFTFSKRKFDIFDSVSIGGREIISPAGQNGVIATDTAGRAYSTSSVAPGSVLVETDGIVRKTVRITGKLSGAGGQLLDCTTRVSLFAGSSDARVELTVLNPRTPQVAEGQPQFWDIGCPNSVAFEDLGMVISFGAGTTSLGGVSGGDRESPGSLAVYQDSSGGQSWDRYRGRYPRPQSYVSFRGYRVYANGSEVASGLRPTPWAGVAGSPGGAVASVRDFWQNYPKALRASSGRLDVSLFPSEYGGPYTLRPGEQKTHEVTLCFHGPGQQAAARRRSLAAQDPLVAAASPEAYMSSGAAGRVTGTTQDPEFSTYELLNSSTIDGRGATDMLDVIESSEYYSWQDYGEEPVDYEDGGSGSFNQKYNFDLGMALQFMRTGDVRWYRLAEAAGRHTADLDLYHHAGAPTVWWDGGFFGHSYHDEEDNTNPNRNYGGPHPDLVFGAPGLFTRYYMTGDPVAFDAAREISDNVRYRFDNSFGRGNGEGFAEAPDDENGCLSGRPFACGLWVLTEAYRATGDSAYLGTADWIVQNSHKATDLFLTAPVGGDRRFTKLFVWDLLESSLGRYVDLCAEIGHGDPAGARTLLLAMAHQEAYVMWKQDSRGNKGVPYAWMRDGTPWGWEDHEVAVSVCNWQLLTADALTYGFIYGGDAYLLDRAREAFKTGSDPEVEYYEPVYTATKEATNSANFGLAYMWYRHPPGTPAGRSQFDEWICLENPGAKDTAATLEYLTGDGKTFRQGLTVPAHSRRTVDVNAAVGAGRDVSTHVISRDPVVVERPMYFDYHGAIAGGSVSAGAGQPAKEWHFAEGCTREGFDEWLTIENPGSSAGRVSVSYLLETGEVKVQKVVAPARARTTLNVNDLCGPGHDVSAIVRCNQDIVVERPMYFQYHGAWGGGHDVAGALQPSTKWCFGEGTTRSNAEDGYYEEWLCLQNPGASPASVTIDYLLESGAPVTRRYSLAPTSRTTVDVMREVGPGHDVSAVVRSATPIVAERPMYFSYKGVWNGGDVALGLAGPVTERCFAEGCTRDGFQTWLSIGNPNAAGSEVTVDYFLGTGRTVTRQVGVPAGARLTIDVNRDVGPGQDVSLRVRATEPVMVERPMYFDYHGERAGGHTGTGSEAPATEWFFAEGCTR